MGDLVSLTLKLGTRRGMVRGTPAIAWYERGCALEAAGDLAGAIGAYERAIAGRPDLADAHNNLGRIHHDRHEVVLAEACYRRALAADAGTALFWFNLGVALDDQGKATEAIAAYEQALALDGTLADAHYNLARVLEQVGRSADDELLLRRAVRHLVRYRDLSRAS